MPSLRPAPRRRVLSLSLVLAGCAAPPAERGAPAAPVGPYLGQAAGDAPSLFAPGFVSRRYHEMNAAFSPDGTRLYFASYRPREPGAPPAGDADIWYVERRAGGDFGPPVHVAAPVNTPGDDYYPSVTRDGTLYYSTWDARQRTGEIFRARPVSGTYRVENVGAPINTEHVEYDPFVAPDESYLVFVSSRPGGQGDGDLYVSFRDGARWSDPANLGPAINTPAREYCPSVSADGRHFFFTSKRAADASSGERAAAWTIDEWTARYDAIGNGLGNIYWLRSDFLRDLRAPGRTP